MVLNKKTFRLQFLGIVFSVALVLLSFGQIRSSSQEIIDTGLIKSGEDVILFSQVPAWEDLIPNRDIRDAFVSNTEFGICLSSLDGKFVRVNRALCRILGYSEQELLSMSFVDVTHPQDKAFDIASANTLIADPSRQSYLMLKKYVRKNNEVINCLLEVFIEADFEGKPLYFMGKIVPIDSRVVQTSSGTKLVTQEDDSGFYSFLKDNLPWVVTSILGALSFAILIGRNQQKQLDFNKQIKAKLGMEDE